MGLRIYFASLFKKLRDNPKTALSGGVGVAGMMFFIYAASLGLIDITGYSGDVVCAGTELDPCYAYLNFTVGDEDLFVYPVDYDPWGRETMFDFSPAVKSWEIQRSWGQGWRTIPMSRGCTGTWCGGKAGIKLNTFSVVYRANKSYEIRAKVLKNNPADNIKWGFGFDSKGIPHQIESDYVDPRFLPSEGVNAYEMVLECKNVTSKEYIFSQEEKEVYDCNSIDGHCMVGNASCYNPSCALINASYVINNLENVTKEVCEEVGVKKDTIELKYSSRELAYLRTDDVLCKWELSSGGNNLKSRAPEFRTVCRSGEDNCECVNLTKSLSLKSSLRVEP